MRTPLGEGSAFNTTVRQDFIRAVVWCRGDADSRYEQVGNSTSVQLMKTLGRRGIRCDEAQRAGAAASSKDDDLHEAHTLENGLGRALGKHIPWAFFHMTAWLGSRMVPSCPAASKSLRRKELRESRYPAELTRATHVPNPMSAPKAPWVFSTLFFFDFLRLRSGTAIREETMASSMCWAGWDRLGILGEIYRGAYIRDFI